MKRIGMLLMLLTLVVAASGCWLVVAGAAGATGVLYYRGVAEKSYPYSVEKTYDGVIAGLKDAEITPYQKGYDATSGKIEATLADGKKVKIELVTVGDNVTKVRMRIGWWGDKERSEFIFDKIDKRL